MTHIRQDIGFVVWGIGTRGRRLIEFLGTFAKAAIDVAFCKSDCHCIPIIDIDEYICSYSDYPIIVTPKNSLKTISECLTKRGIRNFQVLDDHAATDLRMSKVVLDNKVLIPDTCSRVCLHGTSIASLYAFKTLSDKGYECTLLQGRPDVMKDTCQDNVPVHYFFDKKPPAAFQSQKVRLFEDFFRTKELFYRENLRKYKDTNKKDRCFIVATGPSLKYEDLEKLYGGEEVSFSCNRMITNLENTNYRPTYYVLSDNTATNLFFPYFDKYPGITKFVADLTWLPEMDNMKNVESYHLDLYWQDGQQPFSDDICSMVFAGKTVVYVMLQMAVFMGFKNIYLLGVDCTYKKGGTNNYFGVETEPDTVDHETQKMLMAYKSAKAYSDAHGIHIYNSTRGGSLKVFERVNFDSLF